MPIINMVYKKKKWWKPWANTVAYFPLKTDLLDHWPNEYSMTNLWGVTISDWAWYFNWSSRLYKTDISSWLPLSTNPKTISLWVKQISWVTHCWFWRMYTTYNNQSFTLCMVSWKLGFSTWWWGYDYASSITPSSSQWYYCVASYDWTTWKHYVNWTQVNSWTLSTNTSWTTLCLWASSDTRSWYENYFKWYLSEVIIENKARTAEEISDYYNQTKSNYWL